MPSLVDLVDLVARECRAADQALPGELCDRLLVAIRREFAGTRVYIPPPGSRKDPARQRQIAEAAKRLPTGVAAEKLGVSASYVYRVSKKVTNPDT